MKDKFRSLNRKTVIAIIITCILAIVAIVGAVVFLKDDGSASATEELAQQSQENEKSISSDNSENSQAPSEISPITSESATVTNNEGNTDNAGNTDNNASANNGQNAQNVGQNSSTSNSNQQQASQNSNNSTGTTTSTTNPNVPNQDYVVARVEEVERQVTEDLTVSWQNLDIAGKFTDVRIDDSGISAEKHVSIEKGEEVDPRAVQETQDGETVSSGDIITYSIDIQNKSGEARKGIKVSDIVPAQTTLIDVSDGGSIVDVNGETKIFWTVDFETNQTNKIVSFRVSVNEDATGTIRNTAIANGNKTNETQNAIITTTKTSSVVKCESEVGDIQTDNKNGVVHEDDTIQYTITVKNTGDMEAPIYLNDTIPDGLSLVATSVKASKADAQIESGNNQVNINGYVLKGGDTLEITFNTTVNALTDENIVEEANGEKVYKKTIDANIVVVNNKKITDSNGDKEVLKPCIETTKRSSIKECSYGITDSSVVHERDIISYTITVSNAKGSEAGIVNLEDTIPDGLELLSNTISGAKVDIINDINGKTTISLKGYRLEAGAELVITFDTRVKTLGTDTNDKKVTWLKLEANKVTVNNHDEYDKNPPTEVKKPNIEISKTSNVGNNYARVGDSFYYTITATNNGDEKGDAVVTDSLPDGVKYLSHTVDGEDAVDTSKLPEIKWTVKDLGVKESRKLKIEVEVKDFDGIEKDIKNTAKIDNDDTKTVQITDKAGKPKIEVGKTSQVLTCKDYENTGKNIEVVHENDIIQYTISVENTGVVSDQVKVRDTLTSQVEYVDNTLTAKVGEQNIDGVKIENGVISLDYDLQAHSKLVITFNVKVKPLGTDEQGNKITEATFEANTVYVNDVPTKDPEGPGKIKKPDLNVTKTSSIAQGQYAKIGEEFKYYITVVNNGAEEGSAVVEDQVPGNLEIKGVSGALAGDLIEQAGNKIKWTVNNLSPKDKAPNNSRTITIIVTPTSINGNDETITNKAEIKDGPSSETNVTVAKPIISTTKASKVVKCEKYSETDGENKDKVKTVHEGDEIEYTIEVTNSGKVAGNVSLEDAIKSRVTYVTNSLKAELITKNASGADVKTTLSKVANYDSTNKVVVTDYSLVAGGKLVITFKVSVNSLTNADGTPIKDKDGNPITEVDFQKNEVIVNGDENNPIPDPDGPEKIKKPLITATKETPSSNKDGNYINEDSEVVYTITVSNNGSEKGNTIVTDTLNDKLTHLDSKLEKENRKDKISYSGKTVTWEVYDLEPGESRKATIKVKVGKIAQGVSETIKNEVKVDGKTTDEEEVTVGKPSIKSEKTSRILECAKNQTTGTTVHEGDKIEYTIKVKNEGTVSKEINVTDTIKAGLTYVKDSLEVKDTSTNTKVNVTATINNGVLTITGYELAPNQEIAITFNVTVNELTDTDYSVDKDGNKIYSKTIDKNIAIVDNKNTEDNNQYEVIKPMINVKKDVSKKLVSVNEEFYYDITVTNVGTDVGSTIVKDTIPNELQYLGKEFVSPNDCKDVVDDTTNTIIWNVDSLGVNESRTLRIKVKAPETIAQNKINVTNYVYKDNNKDPEDSVTTEVAKPVISTTKVSKITACTQTEKALTGNIVHEGDEIEYTITIKNDGDVAGDITVEDSIPSGMTYKDNTLNVEPVATDVKVENNVVKLGSYSLSAKSTLTIKFKVTINPLGKDTNGKNITSATLSANKVTVNNEDSYDPNPPTNVKKANIEISKTSNVGDKYLNVGDVFEYTITATNNGEAAGDAVITDSLPDGVKYLSHTVDGGDVVDISKLPEIKWTVKDLGVNTSRKLKIKVEVKDFDGIEKDIKNTAKIDNGNPDSEITDKAGKPQISTTKESKVVECNQYGMIDKTDGSAKVRTVHEDDEIEYTITISNTGKVTGIVEDMTDKLPAGMSYKDKSLNAEPKAANVKVENNTISLKNYSLEPGETLTITFRVVINKLGTTIKDGKEVPATSIKLDKNKVTVDGNDSYDPNPPTEVTKPIINTTKTSVISECTKNQTNGTTVHEGDKIKYIITVANDGTEYKNINVSDTLKSGVSLLENTISAKDGENDVSVSVSEDKRTISLNDYRLETGHTLTITFEVSVDALGEGVKEATIEANQVIVDNNTTTDEQTYEVVKPIINVNKKVLNAENKDINNKTVDVCSTLKYEIIGTNTGTDDANVTITDKIDITKLTDVTVTGVIKSSDGTETEATVSYNQATGDLEWTGILYKGSQITITIEAKTRNLNESELEYIVENTAHYRYDNSQNKDTDTVKNTVKTLIESEKTATVLNREDGENDGIAEYGDIVEYTITAVNKSESTGKVNIVDELPQGVEYSNPLGGKANPIVVKVNGANVQNGASYDAKTRTISYSGKIAGKATLKLTFKVKVTSTALNEDIVNKATINGVEKTATIDVVKKMKISSTAQVANSMDLVLVLDVSGSMTNNGSTRLKSLKTAAKALVNKVFPDGVTTKTTVTIIAYSEDAETSPTYTCNQKQDAIDKIDDLQSIAGTDINDGLVATNNLLDKLNSKNKVVIFLSDGAPSTPQDHTGLVEIESWSAKDYPTYQNDSVENIIKSATTLKSKADRVYAIGLGTEDGLSSKRAYVTKCDNPNSCTNSTHKAMNDVVKFTGIKSKEVSSGIGWWGQKTYEYYHYYSQTDLAKFVLKTIGKTGYMPVKDGGSTETTTANLSAEFDKILKESLPTSHTIVVTSESPAVLEIPETANIIGDVILTIGGTDYKFTSQQLKAGSVTLATKDVLSYTAGTGFTFKVNNANTMEAELHLQYTVEGSK